MKKLSIVIFTLSILMLSPFFGVNEAAAAAKVSQTVLSTSETSDTTSRITVTDKKMYIDVNNFGNKTIKYTIFKKGVSYLSGVLEPGKRYTNTKLSVANSDYSVRIYCGVYSRTTGCSAGATIGD